MKTGVLFSLLISLSFSSCHLTEHREIEVTSSPSGAKAIINGDFMGETPVKISVPNRKNLRIVLDKPGYDIVEEEIKPEEGFWGWLIWGVDGKGYALPKDTFHYDLPALSSGQLRSFPTLHVKEKKSISPKSSSIFSIPRSSL